MKKTKKILEPAMIGVFVVLSLLLFMTGVVLFGGTAFFEKESLVIAYFDDSLKGLSVGAPVTYRGVSIGQVKEIQLQVIENGNDFHKVIIPIIIALNGGKNLTVQHPGKKVKQEVNDFIKSMCRQGLRAKLKTISLVTGKRYIDLAMYKDTEPIYRDTSGKYLEIPTLPSNMLQAQKIIENMDFGKLYNKILGTFDSLEALSKSLSTALTPEKTEQLMDDLLQVTSNLNRTLKQLDTGIGALLGKVDTSINHIDTTVKDADKLILTLDSAIQPLKNDFTNTLHNLDMTLEQANQLLSQAEKTLQPSSPLYYRINETLQQFKETSRSVQKLSNQLIRNPDSLIFGLQQTGENHDRK